METKTISSYYILQRLSANHSFNLSAEEANMIDWIGQAMRFIGKHVGFTTNICSNVYVENYKVCYPSDLEGLLAILYNGVLLPLGSDISGIGFSRAIPQESINIVSNNEYILELNGYKQQQKELVSMYASAPLQSTADLINEVSAKINSIETYISGINQSLAKNVNQTGQFYNTKLNFIETSFETGYIDIIYVGFPIDNNGYPLVIDNEFYIQAIEWYIILMMIQKGYKHPIFDYKYAKEEFWGNPTQRTVGWRAKASNNAAFPSIQDNERFARMWTQFKFRRELPLQLFNRTEQPYGTIY
jgi:hypothetical protein